MRSFHKIRATPVARFILIFILGSLLLLEGPACGKKKTKATKIVEGAGTWIQGQVKLDNGDIVKFVYSPEGEHAGGEVDTKPAEGGKSMLVTHPDMFQEASGILGTQMSKFLNNAKSMFSLVTAQKVPGMPNIVGYQVYKPKDSDTD